MKTGSRWCARLIIVASLLLSHTVLAASMDDIRARGTVRIGVCECIPWTFTNRRGDLEGSEIDAGRMLARDLGLKPDFKLYSLETIFGALERGQIDLIAAGMAITPARALLADFSSPYFSSGTTVVTHRRLAPDVRRIDDLNKEGYVVVVVNETFSAGVAAQLFDVARIMTVPDGVAAEKAFLEGRAQGYLTNLPDARILARQQPEIAALPLAEPVVGSVAGFAVRHGNQALLNFLNAWIAARTADKSLPQAYDYWFSNYDWLEHARP